MSASTWARGILPGMRMAPYHCRSCHTMADSFPSSSGIISFPSTNYSIHKQAQHIWTWRNARRRVFCRQRRTQLTQQCTHYRLCGDYMVYEKSELCTGRHLRFLLPKEYSSLLTLSGVVGETPTQRFLDYVEYLNIVAQALQDRSGLKDSYFGRPNSI